MSLLMDALKKAEEEKKAAANRLKESEGLLHADVKTEVEAGAATDPDETAVSKEVTGEHKIPLTELGSETSSDRGLSTMELSLAPIEEIKKEIELKKETNDSAGDAETLNINVDEITPDQTQPQKTELSIQQQIPEADATAINELSQEIPAQVLDETFHGISFEDADNPELFQETIQGEAYIPEQMDDSHDETLPGVPAVQLTKDIGGEDQPTPVAAQTVFTATNTLTQSKSSGMKWIMVSLLIIAAVAASVWYYYVVTPVSRNLPSPMVARGIENIVPLQETIQSQPAAGTADPAAGLQPGLPDLVEPLMEPVTGAEEPVTDVLVTGSSTPDAAEQQMQQGADTDKEAAITADASVADLDVDADKAQKEPDSLPEAIELAPAMFKISRSKVPEDRGQLLNEAYTLYKAGDLDNARIKYQEVLDNYPDNRDAILGLGAIEQASGNQGAAVIYYTNLLRMNPQDDLTRAILINLQESSDLLSSESNVKSMIRNSPEQPFLHFTLGNIFAAQTRWAEAQQAFFDAYRLDAANANYAFNLAVSLDRIGQFDTAIDYYNTAIDLADGKSVNFDISSLQARIRTLSGINN